MNRKKLIGIIVTCIAVAVVVVVAVHASRVNNIEVIFVDAHLEASIREAIDIPEGPIYSKDLERLTSLNAPGRNITYLTGLEYCTGLRELLLQENKISNVSPLVDNLGLAHGDDVDLRSNPLSEESINQYIPELKARGVDVLYDISEEEVYFPDVNLEVRVIKAIGKSSGPIYPSDLQRLTELHVYSTSNITDLTGLEYCTNLTVFYSRLNEISDISPLANLISLTGLYISYGQISDISPLVSLTSLTELHLYWNLISDVSALAGLTNLSSLSLSSNQISDISPLADLTSLTDLKLWDNQISDISPLVSLTNLTSLLLHYNQISDISPLVDNTGLGEGDTVDLRDNPLSEESLNIHIPELRARGVTVDY